MLFRRRDSSFAISLSLFMSHHISHSVTSLSHMPFFLARRRRRRLLQCTAQHIQSQSRVIMHSSSESERARQVRRRRHWQAHNRHRVNRPPRPIVLLLVPSCLFFPSSFSFFIHPLSGERKGRAWQQQARSHVPQWAPLHVYCHGRLHVLLHHISEGMMRPVPFSP